MVAVSTAHRSNPQGILGQPEARANTISVWRGYRAFAYNKLSGLMF